MDVGPTLETERLILRVPQAADFERFAEVLGSEEVARYITADSVAYLSPEPGAAPFEQRPQSK